MLQLLLAPMVLYSGATGEFGSRCTGVRAWIFVALQVMLLLPFCFKDARCAVGVVDGGRLDLPRSSLGGGVRRRRAQIQEWDGSGRGPGRWPTANGFIPSLVTGVYFSSFQGLWAMGLVLLKVMPGVFFGGGGRRRGRRGSSACSGSRGFSVIFIFFWVLSVVWLRQLFMYPSCTSLYLYVYLYIFLI